MKLNDNTNVIKKSKKFIAFKADAYDVDERKAAEDNDDEEMTLLPKRFKNLLRKYEKLLGQQTIKRIR